jgi:DNA-binding MarR family transcriptional regulator
MNKRVRYTVNDLLKNNYYQIPKFLFEGEFKNLSNNSRVLYSLLKDRHNLSIKNNWVNKKNEVYLIYTRKDMEEMLGLADKTVKKVVDELINLGLIEEERIGFNKPNRIYLNKI